MGHRARRRHGAADGHHTQQDHPMRLRFVVLALLVATPLRAQTGSARDEMTRAERAYRDLEFDVAASTLNSRRSEEHTSELQSHSDLVCRLLLEKKKADSQNTAQ